MATSGDAVILEGLAKDVFDDFLKDLNIKDPQVSATMASGKGDNYLGDLYRVVVQDGDEESRYILKVPKDMPVFREKFPIGKVFCREVFAYKVLLEEARKLNLEYNIPEEDIIVHPKCFKGGDELLKEFLILEDMNPKGYFMGNRRLPFNIDQIKSVFKHIASLHAVSFKIKKTKPDEFFEWFKNCDDIDDYMTADSFHSYIDMATERTLQNLRRQDHKDKIKEYSKILMDEYRKILDKKFDKPYSVICHGDCWINNTLFKYDKDGKLVNSCLIDWQILKYGSPVIDISHFLCICTDQEFRRKHFFEVLDFYYECLKNRLKLFEEDIDELYPRKVYDQHIKEDMQYGLVLSMLILPMLLGELEDIPDMNELLKKETIELSDIQLQNKQSVSRYEDRINGLVGDFIEFGYI